MHRAGLCCRLGLYLLPVALLVLKVSRATCHLGLEDLPSRRCLAEAGAPTWPKCRLGSAAAHFPPASWGGIDRLLAALRTLEERLSRSDTRVAAHGAIPAARAKATDVSAFDHPGALQREEWSLLR